VKLDFVSLTGVLNYSEVREFQKKWVEARLYEKVPDTVYFLEHEPVVTRGRGLQRKADQKGPLSMQERHRPLPQKIPGVGSVEESERGGDLTYHGPGQLVVYPILKLDGLGWGRERDVEGFLRRMEGVLISVLEPYLDSSQKAEARSSATGVWVGDRKVASLGIAIRRWVTYHGLAVNVVNDLSPFRAFSPCGFSSEVMTRVVDLSPRFQKAWGDESHWRGWFEAQWIQAMLSKNGETFSHQLAKKILKKKTLREMEDELSALH